MLTLCIADVERDVGMKSLSRKEAITILESMRVDIPVPKAAVTQIKRNLALDMAINALNCSEIPNSSDSISRQAAIDALNEQIEQCNKALGSFDISPKDEYAIKVERASLEAYKEQLENMSSAQPERKKDEWIPISKETNPTKSGWYLVTVHAEFNATNGMWYDIDEPTNMYLRWMPLPSCYKGE